jgi:hypothetical protein
MANEQQVNYPYIFTAQEVNLILEGLKELPHKRSDGLINRILAGAKAIEARAEDDKKRLEAAKANAKPVVAKPTEPKLEAVPVAPVAPLEVV